MPSDETPVSSATTPDGSTASSDGTTAPARRTRRRAASRPAGPPQPTTVQPASTEASAGQPDRGTQVGSSGAQSGAESTTPVVKKPSSRRSTKKTAAAAAQPTEDAPTAETSSTPARSDDSAAEPAAPVGKKSTRKRASKTAVSSPFAAGATDGASATPAAASPDERPAVSSPVFQAPDPVVGAQVSASSSDDDRGMDSSADESDEQPPGTSTSTRRRRSRGGRNRRKSSDPASTEGMTSDGEMPASDAQDSSSFAAQGDVDEPEQPAAKRTSKKSASKKDDSKKSGKKPTSSASAEKTSASAQDEPAEGPEGSEPKDSDDGGTSSSSRRRRRRRRSSDSVGEGSEDSPETVVKVREPRPPSDKISSVEGSTRIEAKKQRRREGREAGRRRAPILSESEFLARRESVDRVMVIRQRDDVTQIAVLEDSVLVEHYVALEQQSSLIGNVYLGRVQNVLPSMEAAFIDIGKGRNAVLYAGEVNWDLIGDRNQPRRIENALKSGQQILVQVSKDPVGHKGARLTSQISLPGRYLVYVPGGGSSGISRKLPDTERNRLKNLLKEILPDESGVIIRTAAEGASEEELTRDVRRLTSRWEEIEKLVKTGKAPALLYAEPDITLKVVRDLFTEDFATLVVSGDQAWETVNDYVSYVAPDLTERLERYDGNGDVFDNYRVEEQIAKALERKVWLPSGGSLVIDRTEAMTVVDVNTGKFTGSGGNLEQTVTKNNLEAAEEIVRQLRLRDIGGIIVIDFIDMVLENNRDLVLRRLVECLGRDRTRHQVAEVTSLGLVQMTRKRIGTGLVESFSVPCDVCHGRGVIIEAEPVKGKSDEPAPSSSSSSSSGRSSKRSSSRQRSAKSEPEVEPVDPQAAERHSAAAAATAAIAAALHPESRHEAWASDAVVDTESPNTSGDAMTGDAATEGASAARPSRARKATTKKTTAPAKKAAAKKATAKKATAKKATATKVTASKTATKRASSKKAAAAKSPAGESSAAQVLEPVGASS